MNRSSVFKMLPFLYYFKNTILSLPKKKKINIKNLLPKSLTLRHFTWIKSQAHVRFSHTFNQPNIFNQISWHLRFSMISYHIMFMWVPSLSWKIYEPHRTNTINLNLSSFVLLFLSSSTLRSTITFKVQKSYGQVQWCFLWSLIIASNVSIFPTFLPCRFNNRPRRY